MGLSKETYEKRRKEGLCVQCGKDAGGKSLCESCDQLNRANRARREEKRKAAGLCVNHGDRPAIPGKTICKECSEKSTKAGLKRYYRNKEAQTCRRCGKPPVPGAVFCEEHREAAKKNMHTLLEKRRAT